MSKLTLTVCVMMMGLSIGVLSDFVEFDPLILMFRQQEILLRRLEQTVQRMGSKLDSLESNVDNKLKEHDNNISSLITDVSDQLKAANVTLNDVKTKVFKLCPGNFKETGFGCYKFSLNVASWADAKKACVNFGAKLATIDTVAELDALKEIIKTEQPTRSFMYNWVGGVRKDSDTFVWDGTDVIIGWNWRQNHGPSSSPSEHCMYFNNNPSGSDHGVFGPDPCSRVRPYICEM